MEIKIDQDSELGIKIAAAARDSGCSPQHIIQAALASAMKQIHGRGLTYSQAAERCGISVSTLKRRLREHRQSIRPIRYGHRTVRLRPTDVDRLNQILLSGGSNFDARCNTPTP